MTDEYEKYIDYFPRGENHGTSHVVREEGGTRVTTACGRELRKKTPGAGVTSLRGGYVYEIGDGPGPRSEDCGNCPWDEIDE